MKKSHLFGYTLTAAALLAVAAVTPAQASTVTFNLDTVWNGTAPSGSAPYATVNLDDGGSPGSVDMTVSVSGGVENADITELYLNFDATLDVTALAFSFVSGSSTGPAAGSISNSGQNLYQADGDGKYDIMFDFPPPPGNDKFGAGEAVVYTITSTEAITANSFSYLSAPGGGSGGPFYAASKWNSPGAWIGTSVVVPVPAAVWLFGSGLLGLVGMARRKKA